MQVLLLKQISETNETAIYVQAWCTNYFTSLCTFETLCFIIKSNSFPDEIKHACFRLIISAGSDNFSVFKCFWVISIGYHMRGEVISGLSLESIVTRAIKLILPSLEYDNLFITYLCLYLEQKPDYIFKLFTLRVHFKMNSK